MRLQNSNSVQVLAQFSVEERKDFLNYAQSPYLNRNQKLLPLLVFVLKVLSRKSSLIPDEQELFSTVYPEKSFDSRYLRKQLSLLYHLLKKYLSYKAFTSKSFEQEFYLLQEFAAREHKQLYTQQYDKLQKNLTHSKSDHSKLSYRHFQLQTEQDAAFSRQQKREFNNSLQAKMDALDKFYISEKLKGACEMLNRQKIIESRYTLNLLVELTSYLKDSPTLADVPLIKVYLKVLNTLQDEQCEQHFEELINLLHTFQDHLTKEEARAVFRYAQNYCIRKINQGNKQYFRKLFELFRAQLATKVNLRQGTLSAEDYKNIVSVGLFVQEVKWVKSFIYEFKPFLSEDIRENVFNYNLAYFYYGIKDYKGAIQLLCTVQYTDIYYEISGKIMLAKIYFLINEYEALSYLINAFKLSLKRNKKIASSYRLSIEKFLIQLKRTSYLKSVKPYLSTIEYQQKNAKIRQRIQSYETILDKAWLLNQLKD